MKKWLAVLFNFLLLLSFFSSAQASYLEEQKIFYYPDGRWKMVFHPDALSDQKDLLSDLSVFYEHFGLNQQDGSSVLKLREVKESLLGRHYHYDQYLKNVVIEGAELVASISSKNAKIYLIYSTLIPENQLKLPITGNKKLLTIDEAYDVAWSDLKVTGQLQGAPRAHIMWSSQGGQLAKIYQITLSLSEPKGSWLYKIDAASGKILGKKNKILTRRLDTSSRPMSLLPLVDRRQAFASFFEKKKLTEEFNSLASIPKDGKANVFDPNPVITLQREDLSPSLPDDVFEGAYQQRILKDLSFIGKTYYLKGPWVYIIDWNSPETKPSTSKDGIWEAKRGNNAFNDAMVYYHIDTNQRYIQSLGFKDKKGIISYPIEIDTDGFDGADNSFYDPQLRRLAFGHGCVPDPEDADVILHEYGHGIQHHIVPHWGDKDADAIGEGFGDYWATSYRHSKQEGSFLQFKVFAWDSADGCWDGRRTDRTDARYDPSVTYSAHGQADGFVHDELWSTPLVQSLVELKAKGKTHETVDQIVLQSHFGLSSGITMAEMAYATVEAAKMLFPSVAIYSKVFRRQFEAMDLL